MKTHSKNEAIQIAKVLKALIELNKVSKILDSFIPAFLNKTIHKDDGRAYLHGNFNLGSVKSGRMSSNNPNMQNLPSGSGYAKFIKSCFKAPKGYLLVTADFKALEAVINALLTKDPNKLKVYTEGFDSHCLNTYTYWKDKFTNLDPNNPEHINNIANTHEKDRSKSKAVTFALQFFGTYRTLMNNSGFSEEEAKSIVKNYEELYQTSIDWVNNKLKEASETGYVEGAFGLKLRTPVMKQVLWGSNKVPYEASAESRTAGNMLSGQSFGLLNNRAQNAFMELVYRSKHRLDILPIAAIHDALYFMIKKDAEVLKFTNDNLIECMEWQDDPNIYHDKVKLGAELEIMYPTWADSIGLPNKASIEDIEDVLMCIDICESTQNEKSK
jgi:DNA polymerase I